MNLHIFLLENTKYRVPYYLFYWALQSMNLHIINLVGDQKV